MPTPLLVRQATPTDAPAVEALYRELVSNPAVRVTPERLSQLARDAHNTLLVAEQEEQVVGTALLTLCLDVMFGDQPFGVVENVVVAGQFRGAGVGRALFREIEKMALDRQCSKLMLLSTATRHGAHHFFARMGFQSESKRGFIKYRRSFSTDMHAPLPCAK